MTAPAAGERTVQAGDAREGREAVGAGGAPGGQSAPDAFERALGEGRGWGLTRGDLVVAGVTLVAAGLLAWGVWGGGGRPTVDGGAAAGAPTAVVQNADGFYRALPLDRDARVTVEGPLGTNVIEVAEGRVRCVESDCGNQVCVQTGWVGSPGEMVVCLPHRLTVQVVADEADAVPLV